MLEIMSWHSTEQSEKYMSEKYISVPNNPGKSNIVFKNVILIYGVCLNEVQDSIILLGIYTILWDVIYTYMCPLTFTEDNLFINNMSDVLC